MAGLVYNKVISAFHVGYTLLGTKTLLRIIIIGRKVFFFIVMCKKDPNK